MSILAHDAITKADLNSIGATEEEVAEFILSTLKEISIMACSIAMPIERREQIAQSITLFEGCAGLYRHNLILRDAANCR